MGYNHYVISSIQHTIRWLQVAIDVVEWCFIVNYNLLINTYAYIYHCEFVFFAVFFTYIQNYNIRYLDYNVRALYSHIGVVKSTYIDYEAATHPTVYVHTVYGLYTHVIKLVELNILYVYPMAHGTLLIAVHIYLRIAYVVYYTRYNV